MDDPADTTVTLEVLRWFARGRCLARDVVTGDTSLVSGALPGERVAAAPSPARGERWQTVDVLRASPWRVAPACAHADRCTGCTMLHVHPAHEADYKALTVSEVLSRYADIDVAPQDIDTIVAPSSYTRGGHRVRARLSLEARDGQAVLGLRDRAGKLVHIPDCPALHPELRRVAMALCRHLDAHTPFDATSVELLLGVEGVAAIVDEPVPAPLAQYLDICADVVAYGRRDGRDLVLVRGAWPRQLPVAELDLQAGVDAWTQPCPERASALYAWVEALGDWEGTRVLDATCGTGGLALMLAGRARHVTGVDASWPAVQSAVASAAARGIDNVAFRGGLIGTVAPRMARDGERFDHIVVNPMRRSLGDDTMAALAALGPRRIVYLAPAPRAGAADLAALLREGYVVDRVGACDLHPGTGHVMACVVLVASDRAGRTG